MRIVFILTSLVFLLGCQKDVEIEEQAPQFPRLMEIPKGFPEIEHPEGNEFTYERWALGKELFFDTILSVDSSISCASCHSPVLGFSDDKKFSFGVEERIGTRNSSPLANLAYHPYFTREGGIPTLEMQILVPIQEHNEFDFNIVLIAERLKQIPAYVEQAQKAYGREPDAFVITRSLSCFERSLISGGSRYDQYQFQNDNQALTISEQRGMDLFFSERTNCSECHSGFNFTDYSFQNNGLYETYVDEGRYRLTGDEADKAVFKVPSLRNVSVTAPYMHDGHMQSLEEVVEHYNSGGKLHPNRSDKLRPLSLTIQEKSDLVAFLHSLTDETFILNPLFSE